MGDSDTEVGIAWPLFDRMVVDSIIRGVSGADDGGGQGPGIGVRGYLEVDVLQDVWDEIQLPIDERRGPRVKYLSVNCATIRFWAVDRDPTWREQRWVEES